jgi:hypothetical protein
MLTVSNSYPATEQIPQNGISANALCCFEAGVYARASGKRLPNCDLPIAHTLWVSSVHSPHVSLTRKFIKGFLVDL